MPNPNPQPPTPAESTTRKRCTRCDKSAWWHRVQGIGLSTTVLCHDGRPSPTITPAQMARVHEALTHIRRLDLPSPYEELTLFPADQLDQL